eukprot:6363036-Pyramimonas_sp.AAC.1
MSVSSPKASAHSYAGLPASQAGVTLDRSVPPPRTSSSVESAPLLPFARRLAPPSTLSTRARTREQLLLTCRLLLPHRSCPDS